MKNLSLLLLAGVLALVPVHVSGMISRGGEVEKGKDEEHGDKKFNSAKATEERSDKEQIAAAKKAALQGQGNPDLENNREVVEEETISVSEEVVDFKTSRDLFNASQSQKKSEIETEEENNNEDLFDLTTLEQRIQEAQKLVSDLNGKGTAIGERALRKLILEWIQRCRRYKKAQSDFVAKGDFDEEISQKREELLQASSQALETLEQSLLNLTHDETTRIDLSWLARQPQQKKSAALFTEKTSGEQSWRSNFDSAIFSARLASRNFKNLNQTTFPLGLRPAPKSTFSFKQPWMNWRNFSSRKGYGAAIGFVGVTAAALFDHYENSDSRAAKVKALNGGHFFKSPPITTPLFHWQWRTPRLVLPQTSLKANLEANPEGGWRNIVTAALKKAQEFDSPVSRITPRKENLESLSLTYPPLLLQKARRSVNPTFAIRDGDLSQYTWHQNVLSNRLCVTHTPHDFKNHFGTKSLQNIIHSNSESRVNADIALSTRQHKPIIEHVVSNFKSRFLAYCEDENSGTPWSEEKEKKNRERLKEFQEEADKAATVADAAIDTINQASPSDLSDELALYDQAILKYEESETAQEAVLKACRAGLATLAENPHDPELGKLREFWEKEIAEANDIKNRVAWGIAQLKAAKVALMADAAIGEINQAPPSDQPALYDQAILKQEEWETAQEAVLKACKAGLAALTKNPHDPELGKLFWEKEIVEANDNKNRATFLTAHLKAHKAAIVADAAIGEINQAPPSDQPALYDQAISKQEELETALEAVLKACKAGLAALAKNPHDPELGKLFWEKKIAEANDNKNRATLVIVHLKANKAAVMADAAIGEINQAPPSDQPALYDQAISKQEELETALEAVLKACKASLAALTKNPHDPELGKLREFWEKESERASDNKNKAALETANLKVRKAAIVTQTAIQKINQASLSDKLDFYDQAIKKAGDWEVAYEEVLKICNTALAVLPENRSDLEQAREFWNQQITKTNLSKKINVFLITTQQKVAKEKLILLREIENIHTAPLSNQFALFDQAIAKGEEIKKTWEGILQLGNDALAALPKNRSDLAREFLEKEIELANNNKNRAVLEIASIEVDKAQLVTQTAIEKIHKAPRNNQQDLFNLAILEEEKLEKALKKVLEASDAGLKALPENRSDLEEAREFWKKNIEEANNNKNKIALNFAGLKANKARSVADAAIKKMAQIPLCDQLDLFDKELVETWDAFITVCTTSLADLPKNRSDLKEIWEKIIPLAKAEKTRKNKEQTFLKNLTSLYQKASALSQALTAKEIQEILASSQPGEEVEKTLKDLNVGSKKEIEKSLMAYVDVFKKTQKLVEDYLAEIKGTDENDLNERSQWEEKLQQLSEINEALISKVVDSLDFTTEENKAVFWTGYDEKVQEQAMKYAREHGKSTIEMTRGGGLLDALRLYELYDPEKPESSLSADMADLFFKAASKKFAESVTGEVHVFLPSKKPRLGSAFKSTEEPIVLKNNPLVTSLEEHVKAKSNWRTWESEEENNDRELLFSNLNHIYRNDSSLDWVGANDLRQKADQIAQLTFQLIDKAEQASHPKIALSYWKQAIAKAKFVEELLGQSLSLFEKEQLVPQELTEEKRLKKIISYIKRDRDDWRTGVQWCVMKEKSESVSALEGRMESLLLGKLDLSKADKIARFSKELENAVQESQLAVKSWKQLQEEFLPKNPNAKYESEFIKNKATLLSLKKEINLTSWNSRERFQEAAEAQKKGNSWFYDWIYNKAADYLNLNTPQSRLRNYSGAVAKYNDELKKLKKGTKTNDIEARSEWNGRIEAMEKFQEHFATQVIGSLDFTTQRDQALFVVASDFKSNEAADKLIKENQKVTFDATQGGKLLTQALSDYIQQGIATDLADKLTIAALEQFAREAKGRVQVILPPDISGMKESIYEKKLKPILESNPYVTLEEKRPAEKERDLSSLTSFPSDAFSSARK